MTERLVTTAQTPAATGALLTALLSRKEVAHQARVCPHTIARWERAGLLVGIRINQRVVRYRAADVAKLLEGQS